ncbi:GntR family transcriptional regulator [Lentisphaera profundi]|uniref:GntR family transcriptional regulator n=1 Tax=Lentisphaera profundi TaxID=1658616 RepID=A0ABY7VWR1_9BACT|nr:GntR family transcriptional regulator [Lentisphaera profundi]WDE97164.1 GntR family transcriptional regulator [Lentisphaera profundi]
MSKDKVFQSVQIQSDSILLSLKESIAAGAFPTNKPIPPVRTLGEQYNISRQTISTLLKRLYEENYIYPMTNGRYKANPKFVPNSLDTGEPIKLCFIGEKNKEGLGNDFYGRIYQALEQHKKSFNLEVDYQIYFDKSEIFKKSFEAFDAIILAGDVDWIPEAFAYFQKQNKIVTSCLSPINFHLPRGVRIDNVCGGEALATHIIDHHNPKIKRMKLIGISQNYPDFWHEQFSFRVTGFKKVWLEKGRNLAEIEELILPMDYNQMIDQWIQVAEDHQEGDAYFALSDKDAQFLISSLSSVDKICPLIFCPDNSEIARSHQLTSLFPDPEKIAHALAHQLRVIEIEGADYKQLDYISPELIVR